MLHAYPHCHNLVPGVGLLKLVGTPEVVIIPEAVIIHEACYCSGSLLSFLKLVVDSEPGYSEFRLY